MISKVYHWSNRQIMVFDEKGEQMPEYQKDYLEIRDKILKDSGENTKFYFAIWGVSCQEITREVF